MWKATFDNKIEWSQEALTSMDAANTYVQTRSNFRTARRYSVVYNDGDDDSLLSLLHPECDWGTLWGVVSGPIAIRISLAQERERMVRFTGLSTDSTVPRNTTASSSGDRSLQQAFTQVTDNIFERNGWSRRIERDSWLAWLRSDISYSKVRETLVVVDGLIIARSIQLLPRDGVVMILGQSNTSN